MERTICGAEFEMMSDLEAGPAVEVGTADEWARNNDSAFCKISAAGVVGDSLVLLDIFFLASHRTVLPWRVRVQYMRRS
jgi:hypothetical protein